MRNRRCSCSLSTTSGASCPSASLAAPDLSMTSAIRAMRSTGPSATACASSVLAGVDRFCMGRTLLAHAGDALADGARIAHGPASCVDLRQELGDGGVEGAGLLDIDGMPAVGDDEEGGARARALDEHTGQQAWPVLVAGHDQHRHSELAKLLLELEYRRPLALHAELGVGRALGRVLCQHGLELGKAARVLVLELH